MKNETFFLDYLFVPFCTHVNEVAFDAVANSTKLFCTFCPKSGFTEFGCPPTACAVQQNVWLLPPTTCVASAPSLSSIR